MFIQIAQVLFDCGEMNWWVQEVDKILPDNILQFSTTN